MGDVGSGKPSGCGLKALSPLGYTQKRGPHGEAPWLVR